MSTCLDTITAIATPPGKGGVAIVRVSGPACRQLAETICGELPEIRKAHFCQFKNGESHVVDEGLVLYFQAPHSFTGEDVLELQGHGGPVVVNRLLQACLQAGARLARPGEFSERAFLNNKIDLVQAEAIADLIDAQTDTAARSALRSLQGEFSQQIQTLVAALIRLRLFVEAAIDFPDEDIEFIENSTVKTDLRDIRQQLDDTVNSAKQGVLLKDGMTVVIAGKPNAGKSSLLNCLSGRDSAIVTPVAGTTRDVLREHIHIDGMPLHVLDTAGLRETDDQVELEGVRRARGALAEADLIVWVSDVRLAEDETDRMDESYPGVPVLRVLNKVDLLREETTLHPQDGVCYVSAKTGRGLDRLKEYLKQAVGYHAHESTFIARARHVEALEEASHCIQHGLDALTEHQACELLAEDLRQAQTALNRITGEFTSDDLLGEIFSSFCIGK